MELLNVAAALITLAAVFSFINHRFIKLPTTIGLMLIALIMSLCLIGLDQAGFTAISDFAESMVAAVDFDITLLYGMLSFLLFAGALHVDISDLAKQKWVIASLASVGLILSTFLVGSIMWFVFELLGLAIPYIYCLLFGALISPTDPIAVLSILKQIWRQVTCSDCLRWKPSVARCSVWRSVMWPTRCCSV